MIIGVTDDVVVGGRLSDWISLGLLTSSVPRDVVDEVVAATGRQARRSDGTLPPRMMVGSVALVEGKPTPAVVGAFRSDGEGEFGEGSHYP